MMADPRPRPGNPDRGWNDPPMFNFNPQAGSQQGSPRRTLLNKRVAYPQTTPPVPGVAQKVPPSQSDPGAPVSPLLLPPTTDISTPTPVPLLVPSIMVPAPPPGAQGGAGDERMEDLLKRLHLDSDSELLQHTGSVLDAVFSTYRPNIQDRACEDIQRKLALFRERWQKGVLSEAVRCKVSLLALALQDRETEKAHHHHLALMVDHTAEVNQWMVGIKRLIQEQNLEKEKQKSETEPSTVEKCPVEQPLQGLEATAKQFNNEEGKENIRADVPVPQGKSVETGDFEASQPLTNNENIEQSEPSSQQAAGDNPGETTPEVLSGTQPTVSQPQQEFDTAVEAGNNPEADLDQRSSPTTGAVTDTSS